MRLFIALDLPTNVRSELAAVQARLRRASHPVRWANTSGLHLTLQFLGETPAEQVPALCAALETLPDQPFELRLGHIGAFPNMRRPRVIWAGVAGATAELGTLQQAVVAATAPLGFVADDRPFAPHLTLGRLMPNVRPEQLRALADALTGAAPPAPLAWSAGRPALFESRSTPQGVVYVNLSEA